MCVFQNWWLYDISISYSTSNNIPKKQQAIPSSKDFTGKLQGKRNQLKQSYTPKSSITGEMRFRGKNCSFSIKKKFSNLEEDTKRKRVRRNYTGMDQRKKQ